MSFLNSILKSFLGDKNANDLKEVRKVVAKIKAVEPQTQQLSDEGLREKIAEFKEKIKASSANVTSQIEKIKEEIANTSNIDEKEALFNKIETLKKEAYDLEEKVLTQILPEAFSLVKRNRKKMGTKWGNSRKSY